MQEMQVKSLDGEDLLQEGRAAHSSILAWEISRTEESDRLQSTELQNARHGLATKQQQYATSQSSFTNISSSSIFQIVCDSLQIPNPCTSLAWQVSKTKKATLFYASLRHAIGI